MAPLLVVLCGGCSSVNHGVRMPVYQIPFMILEHESAPPALPDPVVPPDPIES